MKLLPYDSVRAYDLLPGQTVTMVNFNHKVFRQYAVIVKEGVEVSNKGLEHYLVMVLDVSRKQEDGSDRHTCEY